MAPPPAPLTSVVVPCYNQGRYLGDALASALAQDDPALEVVVIDDGSDDETPDVIARYPGVRSLRQPNRGLAHARNAGLAASRGAYVVFLDADDRLLPGAISAGVAALEADPASGFVFGHYRRIDAAGRPLRTPVEPCEASDAYDALLRTNFISMPAQVTFRREALDGIGGFDVRNPAAADYQAYLAIARTWPIRCHHTLVAEYRLHDANMTRNVGRMLRATVTARARQRAWIAAHPHYRPAAADGHARMQVYYATRLADLARRQAADGRWLAAAASVLLMARYCPAPLAGSFARRLARPVLGRRTAARA